MKTEVELKACPFCGGEPKLVMGEHYWWVQCFSCSIEFRHFRSPDHKSSAAAAWNTRDPDPLREAVLWYFEAMDARLKVYNSTPCCECDWQWHCAYVESYNTMKQAEADLRELVK